MLITPLTLQNIRLGKLYTVKHQCGDLNMSRKTTSGLVVAFFLAAMAVSAAEHGDHGAKGRGFGNPERMVEAMTRHLQLDEVQSQSIGNIVAAARPEIDDLRGRASANRKAIADLDTSDPDYGAKLQNLSDENGYLASQATLLHGRLRAEINEQLTPEQRTQFAERSQRMGRHSGKHLRHGDHDSDPE
jgi:Spy/CpxP family protein refolding chaperone